MVSEVEEKSEKNNQISARKMNTHHITGPEEYFEKFHSDLQLPPYVLGDTRDLWDKVGKMVWQGKKPSGIAGCILYKASQDSNSPRTQSEVCKVWGISEVTLRDSTENIESNIGRIIFQSISYTVKGISFSLAISITILVHLLVEEGIASMSVADFSIFSVSELETSERPLSLSVRLGSSHSSEKLQSESNYCPPTALPCNQLHSLHQQLLDQGNYFHQPNFQSIPQRFQIIESTTSNYG